MFDVDLWGKIITGLITASATLIVCLVNNYYQAKRDEKSREEASKKQLDQIRSDYSDQIDELKTDLYAKFQDLKSVFETMANNNTHAFEMIRYDIKLLQEKQDKYNHLQERTNKLEMITEVTNVKIDNIMDKIESTEK